MIAKPELLEQISKFATGGSSMSMTTLRAAMVSLQDKDFIKYSLGKAQESKDYLYGVLKQHNYEPLPSGANFVMFPIRMKGEDFVSRMLDQASVSVSGNLTDNIGAALVSAQCLKCRPLPTD